MTLARLVFPALRWRPTTGFSHEDAVIDAALELGVGGFIIFGVPGASAEEVASLTADIRQRAGRPLLLAADLERGAAQQARRMTPVPPPAALASLDDPAVIEWAGAVTGREARELGLNWVCAPVADLDIEPENPIVQTRAFGADPVKVGEHVGRWIGACQAEGVLTSVKHFPGHGRSRHDSHSTIPEVETPLAELERTDLVPFRAAIAAGVSTVMTAHVAFPAWDPSRRPATLSSTILGYLRQELGFSGPVVTDALIMEGAKGAGDADATAIAPLVAGCDFLLYPPDAAATASALTRGLASGALGEGRAKEALARYDAALARVTRVATTPRRHDATWSSVEPASAPVATWRPGDVASATIADRLLARGMIRGSTPALRGVHLAIVDDDANGWYAPGPNDLVRRGLAAMKCFERSDGSRVVLAFAEPRAAKGRAGFGPEAREQLEREVPGAALVVLFAHPRLAAEIPGDTPILLAWHRQPLMQEAVARWLRERLRA